jgi:hypothetical protein
MKANELRIGNYYYGDVLFPSEYNVITANDLVELDSDPLDDYYQPLPLTEEWLLKFGFYKSDNYGNDEYRLDGYSYFRGSFYISDCDECGESVEINFVHELQNLYFALTKKELTIM